jgi:hypothetical protein
MAAHVPMYLSRMARTAPSSIQIAPRTGTVRKVADQIAWRVLCMHDTCWAYAQLMHTHVRSRVKAKHVLCVCVCARAHTRQQPAFAAPQAARQRLEACAKPRATKYVYDDVGVCAAAYDQAAASCSGDAGSREFCDHASSAPL